MLVFNAKYLNFKINALKASVGTKVHTRMFIAALFITAEA